MPATDNSAVQITINVVDANSGEVVSRVTKSLNSMGAAGAGTGKQLRGGFQEAGEAGSASGKKIADGMDKAGAHSLNALDNVRLVRDDLGIRIPRAMEKVISQSGALMGVIGGIGTGLIALGAIEVLARMGQQVYELYERWLDTNKAVKEYQEKSAAASQQKLFDDGSFNTTLAFLGQANAQMEQLQAKKTARQNSSIIDNIFLPHSTAPRFTTDDDKHLAQAQDLSDRENLRSMQQSHELMLKNIEDHEKLSKASASSSGAIAVERKAALQRDRENRDYARETEQANAAIYNRAHDRDPKKFPGTYQPSKQAGQQEFDASENGADLNQRAASTELQFQQQRDLMKLKQEADNQGLAGDRLLQAQRVAAIEDLNAKYKFQTQNNRQYRLEEAEVNRRYDAEEQQRLQEQTREVRKRVAEEASKGLTGLAANDARAGAAKGQVDQDLSDHKYFGNRDQQQEHAAGLKGAIDTGSAAEAMQQQTQFNERLAQMDAARSDKFEGENQRIQSSADRSVAEIQKAWRETYGQLDVLDQRRVQSFAAVQAETVKIQQDADRQKRQSSQRIEDETVKMEREGARAGHPRSNEQTQAIIDEYNDRYQRLEELRQQDADNADKYRRQEIAAEQIKNGKLLDQQREMRDKLAGELQGLFSNPLEALKRQGEQMASKYAASFIMKTVHPEPGQLGTDGKRGGGLFGLPENWQDVGGFNQRRKGMPSGPLTASPSGAASTSLHSQTATIHIDSATITGLSGGGSGVRNANYVTGGGQSAVYGRGAGGSAGITSFPTSTSGGDAGFSSVSSSASSTPGASSMGTASASSLTASGSRLPDDVSSVIGGVHQLSGMQTSVDTLGKQLGAGSAITNKIPGMGSLSKLADPNSKLGGVAGGALGLFSAFEGSGGVGGAFQGAMSGAQLGAQFGGPAGAAIGAIGGAVLGFIGFGARQKAAHYDKYTVKPQITAGLASFEAGATDYQTVYDSLTKTGLDAKLALRQFGSGASGYYNDTVKPEIDTAQQRLTREQQAGRSQFGMTAAQFHTGGRVWGFGSMGTTGDQGFIHAQRDEFMVQQRPAMQHSTALQYINAGASHNDMAAYYGGSASSAPTASSLSDVNLHFHSPDAKGARQLLMDNKHHIRAAMNASYEENSGGYDIA